MLALPACSDIPVSHAKSTTGRLLPNVPEVPEADETVRGETDPPIVTLGTSQLKERSLSRDEELPSGIIVPNTNLNAVPVTSALQAVLDGTDVSLSWEAGSFENRLVTVTDLSGPLPRGGLRKSAPRPRFSVAIAGALELREKETFVIELPSVREEKRARQPRPAMADTISDLSGDKAKGRFTGRQPSLHRRCRWA